MMITYAEAMEAVQGVVCPNCLHTELSAEMRMVGRRECDCFARCEHCGTEFKIEYARFETLAEIQRQVNAGLQQAPCHVCEQTDFALSLKCVQPSQDCFFQARCSKCNTAFRVVILPDQLKLLRMKD
jgi:hypothetical protein